MSSELDFEIEVIKLNGKCSPDGKFTSKLKSGKMVLIEYEYLSKKVGVEEYNDSNTISCPKCFEKYYIDDIHKYWICPDCGHEFDKIKLK